MTQRAFVIQPDITYFIPAKTQIYGAYTASAAASVVTITSLSNTEAPSPYLVASITSAAPLIIDSGLLFAEGRSRQVSSNTSRVDEGFQREKDYYIISCTAPTLVLGVSNLEATTVLP